MRQWSGPSAVFAGAPYARGEAPYQDFSDLIALRNGLIHTRPDERTLIETPDGVVAAPDQRVLTRLRGKNVTADPSDPSTVLWLDLIGTRAVARWACNTAAAMVASFRDMATEGRFASGLQRGYDRAFVPVR